MKCPICGVKNSGYWNDGKIHGELIIDSCVCDTPSCNEKYDRPWFALSDGGTVFRFDSVNLWVKFELPVKKVKDPKKIGGYKIVQ